jgi:hypothetical protein
MFRVQSMSDIAPIGLSNQGFHFSTRTAQMDHPVAIRTYDRKISEGSFNGPVHVGVLSFSVQ